MIRTTSLPVLTACLRLTTSCATVQPGERGLMFSSSGLEKHPLKDGSYLKMPWNDLYLHDVRWQNYREEVDAWSVDDVPLT